MYIITGQSLSRIISIVYDFCRTR